MRIIFIARHYYPHIGGVEKHLKEICDRLKVKGTKISIICEQIENTKSHEVIDGIEIHRIAYPHTKILGLLNIWLWFFKNRKIISRADLIHIHDVFIWYLPIRLTFLQKPTFITFHGWEGIYPIPLKNILQRKLAAMLTQGNICVGKYIEKWYGIKASYITYGAVDEFSISNCKAASSAYLQFSNRTKNSKFKVLYLGRLDEDTGIRTYLKSFREIKQKYPQVEFQFLGDGIFKSDAQDLGEVLGFKENIKPYVKSARFICTSGYLSMLEALSQKKLVFATSDNLLKGDVIELSPFEKYVIHFLLPSTLLRKIEFFLNNPEQEKKMVELGFSWAKSQTWDNIVKTYKNLWSLK